MKTAVRARLPLFGAFVLAAKIRSMRVLEPQQLIRDFVRDHAAAFR